MISKGWNKQRQQQIPFEDDKQEKARATATTGISSLRSE
jgi:hypothetical protein